MTGSNGEFVNLVITLAGHQINSIPNMYFDGVLVPVTSAGTGFNAMATYAGFVHVNYNLGTAGQGAFPRLTGCRSHVDVNLQTIRTSWRVCAAEVQPNLFPMACLIFNPTQGALLFDPRSSTTGYSENPALAIRDYLTNSSYGLGCCWRNQ